MATRDEKNEFSMKILNRMRELNTDCMDAIITYCEETGLEPEVVASLINETLKAEFIEHAEELNYLEKSSKLPL